MQIEIDNAEHIAEILRDEIKAHRGTLAAIAVGTGLGHATVARLLYGETKQPRAHTVIALLGFFGWRLVATKSVVRLAPPRRHAEARVH